jgi:hypothetical protein
MRVSSNEIETRVKDGVKSVWECYESVGGGGESVV